MLIKPSRIERISLEEDINLEIPFFDENHVPEGFCARYARLSSGFIFNKNFPLSDAWSMGDQRGNYSLVVDETEFERLSREGIVYPGVLVGVFNPRSRFNDGFKPYTHLAVFVGEHRGESLFLEQFGRDIRLSTEKDYLVSKLSLKEVIDVKPFSL